MKSTFIIALAILMLLAGCAPAVQEAAPAPSVTPTVTPSVTPAVIPSLTPEPAPQWQRGEDWFVGDWAGVVANRYADEGVWADFGAAVSEFKMDNGCLLRIYQAGDSYETALGSSKWEVTAYDMEGITLTCTLGTFQMEHGVRESIYGENYDFTEGQTVRLTYAEEAASHNPAVDLPKKHLLFGQTDLNSYDTAVGLMLARLPSGEERPWGSGEYPCWFGGYEGMEGGFEGMFCLGIDANGDRLFGQVLHRKDGVDMIVEVNEGNLAFYYGERALPYDDLVMWYGSEGSTAMFPQLLHFNHDTPLWEDVTEQRKDYFKDTFIPMMEAEIAELQKSPQDIWTEREISVRQGYIDYAGKLIRGDFSGLFSRRIPHIPKMVQLDPQYRLEATLAGIAPGDTIEDAKKQHTLYPLSEEEAPRFGIEARWISNRFTDGRGLLISVEEDGRISNVTLIEPGYDTPDGRQVGDPYERDKSIYHAKDAEIEYGGWWMEEGADAIDEITMTMALDKVWDETELDIDGDGETERVTLSGRALGHGVEQPTAIGDEGIVEEGVDFGTLTRLSVYKDGELIFERELPLYTYYNFTPDFCDKFQTRTPGEVYIQCETGGTGLEIPVYRVSIDGQEHELEYIGLMDVYS